MTQKIKLEFSPVEETTFQFQGKEIAVRPYLSISEKISISDEYLNLLFGDNTMEIGNRYLLAEHSLILHLIDIVSNVDVEEIDINQVIYSGLWEGIKNRIVNYESFRFDLNRLISLYQSEQSLELSLGRVVENVGNKIFEVLNKLSDLNAQEFKEVADVFVGELNKLNETVPGITKTVTTKRSRAKKSE